MRWVSAAIGLAWLYGVGFAAAAPAPAPGFQTAAPTAILIDAESGTVLFEKSADQVGAPASMAKLMTVEVVFDQIAQGKIKPEDEFTISENAWRRGGAPSGGSTMYAAIHSKISVQNLLMGLIIHSGNDAGIALAEGISGSEIAFAQAMNARARVLGLTASHFTNATGLPDPDMKVTVRDLARLAQHIIRTYPQQYKMYAERDFTWNKIRQQNRNPLLVMNIGADGMKTGYTKEAGYGLVGSAVQSNLRLIVVVNGMKSAKERADEARKLLEWGFKTFESRILFAEGERVAEAKLFGGEKGQVALTGPGIIRLMVPRNMSDKIQGRVTYTGPISAPVKQGQAIGRLKVWRGDMLALEVPLQAAEDVAPGTMSQRAYDAATEGMINLFRAGAQKL